MTGEPGLGTTPLELVRRFVSGLPARLAGSLLVCGAVFLAGRWSVSPATVTIAGADPVDDLLARLEVELSQGVALVEAQAELGRRHQDVAEVACASVSEHWSDMDRLAQRTARRMAVLKKAGRRRARVTEATDDSTALHGRRVATARGARAQDDGEPAEGPPDEAGATGP